MLVVLAWVVTSIAFNVTAPMLLALLPDAEDMTLVELVVTVLFGAANLWRRGDRLLPAGGWMALPTAALLGASHLFNCRTYVYSLKFIPVALAQTIRATNPMWVVLVSTLFGVESFGGGVLLSLVPLVGGFALAVGASSSSLHTAGLAAAVASVNAQVHLRPFHSPAVRNAPTLKP